MQVCGGDWQDKMGTVGIFFDPPYGVETRDKNIYHHDSTTIAKDVLAWCIERGKRESHRIALCGYDEYETLAEMGWTYQMWTAGGGYGNLGDGQGAENRKREKIWFSPACLKTELF